MSAEDAVRLVREAKTRLDEAHALVATAAMVMRCRRRVALTSLLIHASACFSAGSMDDGIPGAEASSGTSGDTPATTAPPEPATTTKTMDRPSTSSATGMEPDPDSTGEPAACGNGIVEDDEACDDANGNSTDGCLADCSVPTSCADVLAHDPSAPSGIHEINSDGPGGYEPYDVHCDMEHAGGGWTLVIVSADDGHDTWTWENRALLTSDTFFVGNVGIRDEDYKSAALHLVTFSDLLFVHEPSGVWASYDDVGDHTQDVATFMSSLPSPQCDLEAGYPMADGGLTQIGTNLCTTDLYFHAGDWDGSYENQAYCEAWVGNANATHGPNWSASVNGGCPLDDPDGSSLGPSGFGNYETHPPEGIEDVEFDGRGFANGMGLMQPDDRLEMYVR